MICPNCGSQIPDHAAFCPNCGAPVQQQTQQTQQPPQTPPQNSGAPLAGHSKLTILLLCFFLGGIGIHNFVMGENKKGILKIVLAFCFGVSGILALIELILIALDKYKVDPNKYFSFDF